MKQAMLALLLAGCLSLAASGCTARAGELDQAVEAVPDAPAEEQPAPEEAGQPQPSEEETDPEPAVTARFRLGEEEKELAQGDSLGGWTLESLEVEYQEDGSVRMVTAEFSGQAQLDGTLSPSALMEGEWDLVLEEEAAGMLPRYAGPDADPSGSWLVMPQWDDGIQLPSWQEGGEHPCRLTVYRYRDVFAYTTAPSSVQVSAVQWLSEQP